MTRNSGGDKAVAASPGIVKLGSGGHGTIRGTPATVPIRCVGWGLSDSLGNSPRDRGRTVVDT